MAEIIFDTGHYFVLVYGWVSKYYAKRLKVDGERKQMPSKVVDQVIGDALFFLYEGRGCRKVDYGAHTPAPWP